MLKKHNKTDILLWIFLISLGFLTGVCLLKKDVQEGFGALAYGTVPYFEFIDGQNKPITLHMLKGKVWLVNFMSDESIKSYPQVFEVMETLHDKFSKHKNFRLLSINSGFQKFSQLSNEEKYNHWHFLNGDRNKVLTLMKENFYIDDRKDTFSSGLKLFLVDQNAVIRGYYIISGINDIAQIERNLIQLL